MLLRFAFLDLVIVRHCGLHFVRWPNHVTM